MNGVKDKDLLNKIDDKIQRQNAPELEVLFDFPDSWGSSRHAGLNKVVDKEGHDKIQKGYPFEIEFNPGAEYAFVEWRVYKTAGFDETYGYPYTIKDEWKNRPELLNALDAANQRITTITFPAIDPYGNGSLVDGFYEMTFDVDEPVTIIPFCYKQPRIRRLIGFSKSTENRSRDSSIEIEFAANLHQSSLQFDANNIYIVGGEKLNPTKEFSTGGTHFESALFDTENKRLIITPKEGNYPPTETYITFKLGPQIALSSANVSIASDMTGKLGNVNYDPELYTFNWNTYKGILNIENWTAKYNDKRVTVDLLYKGNPGSDSKVALIYYKGDTLPTFNVDDIGTINHPSFISQYFEGTVNSDMTSSCMPYIDLPDSVFDNTNPSSAAGYNIQILLNSGGEIAYTPAELKDSLFKIYNVNALEVTKDNPVIPITSLDDLKTLTVTAQTGQAVVFDSSTAAYSINNEWTPVGTSSAPFKGIFYGMGKTINFVSGSSIVDTTSSYTGLFGFIDGAKINDLTLNYSNLTINTSANNFCFGGLVGGVGVASSTSSSALSVLNNVRVTGSLSVTHTTGNTAIGGIVGWNNGSLTINNTSSVISLTVTKNGTGIAYVGGIIGQSPSTVTINNSFSTEPIDVTGSGAVFAGGLAGEVVGTISKSWASGNVTVTGSGNYTSAGGLAGNASVVNNCYALGNVKLINNSNYNSYAGGLIGYSNSGIKQYNFARGDVELRSKNDNTVSTESIRAVAGGVIGGFEGSAQLKNNIALGESIISASGGCTDTFSNRVYGYKDISCVVDNNFSSSHTKIGFTRSGQNETVTTDYAKDNIGHNKTNGATASHNKIKDNSFWSTILGFTDTNGWGTVNTSNGYPHLTGVGTAVNKSLPLITPYSINITNTTNSPNTIRGNISVSATSAEPSEEIIVMLTVPAGYTDELSGFSFTTPAVTKVGDAEYSFIMPTAAVTGTYRFTAQEQQSTRNAMTNGGIKIDYTNKEGAKILDSGSNINTNFSALTDSTVTLTINPADGYILGSLTVTPKIGSETVSVNTTTNPNERNFIMPPGGVNISAVFEALPQDATRLLLTNGTIAISNNVNSNTLPAGSSNLTMEAPTNSTVTLTIAPYAGYEITSITVTKKDGGDNVINETNKFNTTQSRTFTMPYGGVNISATFNALPQNITRQKLDNGTIAVKNSVSDEELEAGSDSATTTAPTDSNVTLTITPKTGYALTSITVTRIAGGNVTLYTTANLDERTFTMPAGGVNISAVFTPQPQSLMADITVTGGGTGGTISANGGLGVSTGEIAKINTDAANTVIEIKAAPGYKITDISGTGYTLENIGAGENKELVTRTITVMPGNAVTVSVTFERKSVTVRKYTEGEGEYTLSPTGSQTTNTTIGLSAIKPELGWYTSELVYKYENNASPSVIETKDITGSGFNIPNDVKDGVNLDVTVTFSKKVFTVEKDTETGGTFTISAPPVDGIYRYGDTVTIEALPDIEEGYYVNKMTVTSSDLLTPVTDLEWTDNEGSFTIPNADHNTSFTVTVEFKNTYTITASSTPSGGNYRLTVQGSPYITVPNVTTIESATFRTVTINNINVASGYRLGKVTYTPQGEDPVELTGTTSFTFDMPGKDVAVNVEFVLKQADVTKGTVVTTEGSFDVSPTGLQDVGTTIYLTGIEAAAGYKETERRFRYTSEAGYASSGAISGDLGTDTGSFTIPNNITDGGVLTVNVTFEPITYTISFGTVTGGTISFSSTTGVIGDTITVSQNTASPGYQRLNNITVGGTSVNAALDEGVYKASFTISAANIPASGTTISVDASFLPKSFNVVKAAPSNGGFDLSTTGTVSYPATITLSNIVPETGYGVGTRTYTYVVGGVTQSAVNIGQTAGVYQFDLPSEADQGTAVTVSVTFVKQDYGLIRTVIGDTGGSINITHVNGTASSNPSTANYLDEIGFTVTPTTNYRLKAGTLTVKDAFGNDVSFDYDSVNSRYEFEMPAVAVTITAQFELLHTITQNSTAPTNGSFTLSHTQAVSGEVVTIKATPNTGHKPYTVVVAASGGTTPTPTADTGNPQTGNEYWYTFTVPAETTQRTYTVTVSFAANTYSVTLNTVSPLEGSSFRITPNPSTSVAYNSDFTVTFDYLVPGWTPTITTSPVMTQPTPTGTASTPVYTYTMPDQAVTVTVSLAKIPYTLSFDTTSTGNTTVGYYNFNGATTAGVGDTVTVNTIFGTADSVTVSATTDTITVSPATATANGAHTFIMPAHNVTIKVVFSIGGVAQTSFLSSSSGGILNAGSSIPQFNTVSPFAKEIPASDTNDVIVKQIQEAKYNANIQTTQAVQSARANDMLAQKIIRESVTELRELPRIEEVNEVNDIPSSILMIPYAKSSAVNSKAEEVSIEFTELRHELHESENNNNNLPVLMAVITLALYLCLTGATTFIGIRRRIWKS